jgi:hypothetical protein
MMASMHIAGYPWVTRQVLTTETCALPLCFRSLRATRLDRANLISHLSDASVGLEDLLRELAFHTVRM